jgi:hypothetical protein
LQVKLAKSGKIFQNPNPAFEIRKVVTGTYSNLQTLCGGSAKFDADTDPTFYSDAEQTG